MNKIVIGLVLLLLVLPSCRRTKKNDASVDKLAHGKPPYEYLGIGGWTKNDTKNPGNCNDGNLSLPSNEKAHMYDPWTENSAAMKKLDDEERHRSDLAFSLRSRVLSRKEMAEVATLGIFLYVHFGEPFTSSELQQRFNQDLLQQFLLRTIANSKQSKEKE